MVGKVKNVQKRFKVKTYLEPEEIDNPQDVVAIAAFFYPLVLLFKYITGEFMVFVDLEQDEEGAES
ncbi:hypothetical protein ACFLYB_01540 [Chloroflexota bacterium]